MTYSWSSFILMASPAAPASGVAAQPNPILAMAPLLFMMVVFYVLVIRPQRKKQLELEKAISALKKGDRVVTSGGMLGTIVGIKEKIIILRVGDGETKIEVLKSAINGLVNPKDVE